MVKPSGILLCGGGTGGHIYPGIALADAFKSVGEYNIRWIGDPERVEAELVPAAHITLMPYGLARPRPRNPKWILHACLTAWRCYREMRTNPPKVVVALGGYASLLPALMGYVCKRPVYVMEQNAKAGRTNKLLARLARHVFTQFRSASVGLPVVRVRRYGNPVRNFPSRLRGQDETMTLLVMGGSLSARSLNDLVAAMLSDIVEKQSLSIIHLAGTEDEERMRDVYKQAGIHAEVLGYCSDMAAVYERSDIALCRAGATSVAELCSAGLGALYVPLPWAADDHQTANARAVACVGGAVVLPQRTISASGLARVVNKLLADRSLVTELGCSAKKLARPDAAQDIALHIRTYGS